MATFTIGQSHVGSTDSLKFPIATISAATSADVLAPLGMLIAIAEKLPLGSSTLADALAPTGMSMGIGESLPSGSATALDGLASLTIGISIADAQVN